MIINRMSLLQVKSVTKSFGAVTAVRDVSLQIEAGEIVCLLGPSGCGKTTLLRLIAGLEQPDTGEVWFDGRPITHVPPHRRDFGMMFQDFALFPHKNVFDNVAFGLKMHGHTPMQQRQRVIEMLALVDLTGFGSRDVSQLSGGEQQRVALARALAPNPRLLLLDEPLGALDRALRERLMLEVRQILQGMGVTAVYVTHDQAEAFAVGNRLAVMNAGRIEQMDTPQQVFHRPATPFVARFLGFQNLLPGTVAGDGVVETAIGRLHPDEPLPEVGEAVTLLIRPEAASLPITTAGSNQVAGVVTAVSFRGRYYQLWLAAGSQTLTFEVEDVAGWPIGEPVRFQLAAEGMRVYPATNSE